MLTSIIFKHYKACVHFQWVQFYNIHTYKSVLLTICLSRKVVSSNKALT